MAEDIVSIQTDEPASEDKLNRDQYAEGFAHLAETCGTPVVIGLYGRWGVGKTSLMKLIENKLDAKKIRAIWFDPWQHQFDENPVVALAHTLVDSLELKVKEEGEKILTLIATAFGSTLLKSTIGLKTEDILKWGKIYEEERFQVRDTRVRLREHFEKLVERAKGSGEKLKRIVFFIDDLDRCMPDEALKLLEALKLYLNIKGCVYFLGVDRHTLEQSIKHRYKDLEIKEVDYLDKIVQLPFQIPLIEPQCMDSFIEPLLSKDLQSCKEMLVVGLGDNPRQVKRFINALTLNHQLAKPLDIPNYDPKVLTLLLLIQLITPELYRMIAPQPDLLIKLKQQNDDTKVLFNEFLATHEPLRKALNQGDLPDEDTLKIYLYLTRTVSVTEDIRPETGILGLPDILQKHKIWVESSGDRGQKADLREADLRGADLNAANLRGANLNAAILVRANLREANLRGADLWGANLGGANLGEANLRGANLSVADLRGADLGGAELGGADLGEADLQKADLRGANLREANLRGAQKLTTKQLSEVRTLYMVKNLDEDLMKQVKEKYPHLLEKPKEEE